MLIHKPNRAIAPLPPCHTNSSAFFNFLLPSIFQRLGRWRAYVAAALLGTAGCLVCMAAMLSSQFPLLLLGAVLIGVSMSFAQNYRFGVIRCVPEKQQPVAISWVLAGGVAGAVIGPEFSKHTVELLPGARYGGIFLVGGCICALHCLLLLLGRRALRGLAAPSETLAAAVSTTTATPSPAGPSGARGDAKPQPPPATSPATSPAASPATSAEEAAKPRPASAANDAYRSPPPIEASRRLVTIFAQPRCAASTAIAALSYGCVGRPPRAHSTVSPRPLLPAAHRPIRALLTFPS